jgi:hypothetical protein
MPRISIPCSDLTGLAGHDAAALSSEADTDLEATRLGNLDLSHRSKFWKAPLGTGSLPPNPYVRSSMLPLHLGRRE